MDKTVKELLDTIESLQRQIRITNERVSALNESCARLVSAMIKERRG